MDEKSTSFGDTAKPCASCDEQGWEGHGFSRADKEDPRWRLQPLRGFCVSVDGKGDEATLRG